MTAPSTDPRSLPADVKRKLLAARDALTEGDAMEAYHQIYSIAAPHFDKLADEVWTGLESPSPEPRDELGWLIERNDGTQPQWLRVMDRSFVWVIDASTALRFARKTDAENFMRLHPEKTVVAQAVEHMWCPRSPETKREP